MPPSADVRLTIAPAHGLEWLKVSSTVRRLGLGLLVVLVVGGVGLLLVPAHLVPRVWGLLGAAVVLAVVVTLVRAGSSGRVRVEVRKRELVVAGIKRPVVVPIREVRSACVVSGFPPGLCLRDPLLMVFNRQGRAVFTLSGRPWAADDWDKLLRAIGVTDVARITEPLSRRDLDHRYPEAHSATYRAAARRRTRLGLVFGVLWGALVILLILR